MLSDRYEILGGIGSGGMGTVWKAKDRLLDRIVAVKRLHPVAADRHAFIERLRREARLAAQLAHPNVVAVHDAGEANGAPYIVMEFVDGESVQSRLSAAGPLSIEETQKVGSAVLSALEHAHAKQLIHRDIKPSNVLIERGSGQIKVADFGIAKAADDAADLTGTQELVGTPEYLAPERLSGHAATVRSDLYAVGCLLYACLAGVPPFRAENAMAVAMRHLNDPVPSLRDRRPDVPVGLEDAIQRAMLKDPAARFGSAQEMHTALTAPDSVSDPDATAMTRAFPGDVRPSVAETVPAAKPRPAQSAPTLVTSSREPRSSRFVIGIAVGVLISLLAFAVVLQLARHKTGASALSSPRPTAPQVAVSPTVIPSETPLADDGDQSGADLPPTDRVWYLSEREPVENRSFVSVQTGDIEINGTSYPNSVYLDSETDYDPVEISWELAKRGSTFVADIGIGDKSNSGARAQFTVFVDQKIVAQQTVATSHSFHVDVPVKDALRVTVRVAPATQEYLEYFPAWGDARVIPPGIPAS